MAEETIDYRRPARDALASARATLPEADAADAPLIWATLSAGYAGMTIAGAIMTTGTAITRGIGRVVSELSGIREELGKIGEAVR